MAKKRILIVEDDENISELLSYVLTKDGYEVSVEHSGEKGLSSTQKNLPDLLLLDLMLPNIDGLEVCKTLKADPRTASVPIVMLTAKGEEADIVTGLELGADDYITKPFSPRVLVARIKAVMRRKKIQTCEDKKFLKIEGIEIDPVRHSVKCGGKPVELTSSEFKMLYMLAKRPGAVFTRYQIVDGVHGSDYPVTERSVDVQVVGLRKKLGSKHGQLIETVRGVGYRFKDPDE